MAVRFLKEDDPRMTPVRVTTTNSARFFDVTRNAERERKERREEGREKRGSKGLRAITDQKLNIIRIRQDV